MILLDGDSASIAQSEARLILPNTQGYVCMARDWSIAEPGRRKPWVHTWAPASELERLVSLMVGESDVYLAQATFAGRRRAVTTAREIRCAFVDLDVYNRGLVANDDLVEQVLRTGCAAGLPSPTYITMSGRGMYLKWVFSHAISDSLLTHWRSLIRMLQHVYRDYGADPKASDVSRVLRPAQTYNGKSGALVHIHPAQGGLVEFASMCEAASRAQAVVGPAPAQQRTVAAREMASIRHHQERLAQQPTDFGLLDQFAAAHEPILLDRKSVRSLNWNRFLDLRDLAFARGGIQPGSRDLFLFWMATFLSNAGVLRPDNFWPEINTLLQAFPQARDFDPTREATLTTLYDRLCAQARGEKVILNGREFAPVYTPSNDHLINALEITDAEQRGMRTIISSAEKAWRADERVPGRRERREERQTSQRVAATLRAEGVPVAQIAEQLGKARSTVYEWLTQDPRAGEPVIEKRGRHTKRAQRFSGGEAPVMSDQEVARRTRICPGKKHLRAEAHMSPEEIRQWFAKRSHSEPTARELYARNREQANLEQKDAEDARHKEICQRNLQLLERLRQKSAQMATTGQGARPGEARAAPHAASRLSAAPPTPPWSSPAGVSPCPPTGGGASGPPSTRASPAAVPAPHLKSRWRMHTMGRTP